jgi:hypothetical protein
MTITYYGALVEEFSVSKGVTFYSCVWYGTTMGSH